MTHPIQYQVPLFRYLTASGQIALSVFFLSDVSLRSYHDSGFQREVKWDVPLLGGYHHQFLPGLGKTNRLSFCRPLVHGLRRRLRAGRFDAVWIHGYAHQGLLAAIVAARSLGIRLWLRGDSIPASGSIRNPRARLKQFLAPAFLRLFDGFLTVGTLNRNYYRSFGVPQERLFSTPYAVDNDFFIRRCAQARLGRERLRAQLKLTPGRPVVLFAAKFQTRKRAADLIEAFCRLSPDGKSEPHPYLLLIGEGEEGERLRARVAAMRWDSIRFMGFRNQSELPDFYDLCDVFVLPAAAEPWGLVINEVLNAAKPVIVSDQVGCAPDLVEDSYNGFVVPLGDIDILSARLHQLCGDCMLRRIMGQRGAQRVAHFDFKADLEGLLTAWAAPSG
ncbi:MAG TPA: glycosyltransferase family 4 protein [Candidatus Binataceae bacterium]|nr:glycosyltransferase family 4 protein [Candidatus Binataceae bacterium]